MTVEVDDRRLRLIIDPPGLEDSLRDALADRLVPAGEFDEVGFLLQPGDGRSTLTVLVDRGGVFLVRRRDPTHAVLDVAALINSLVPPSPDAIGLWVRAVATGNALTVGSFEGLRTVTNATREIERQGATLLPTVRTWIDPAGKEIGTDRVLRRFAIAVDPLEPAPSWAQRVAALASTVINDGDEQETLDRCEALTDVVEFIGIAGDKPAELAEALIIS